MLIRPYHTEVSIVSWPVSPLLSVYLLSLLLLFAHYRIRKGAWIIAIILFALTHWILSGIFEIILTRFFRLPEQYHFMKFDQFLLEHMTTLIDGLLWCLCYLFVFSWLQKTTRNEMILQEKKALEHKLSSSELNLLTNEINPHFLFNAMNGIAMKVRLGENKLAVNMLASLNDLLRLSLAKRNDDLIPLHEELELLEKYMMIEKVRFGDHFSLTQTIPDGVQSFKVPKLILQPLVENAFKHGMDNNLEKMILKVEGQLRNEQLKLTVYNSQNDPHRLNYATSNIGLPNVAHRLRRFFGTNFQFQSFREKNGVVFSITLPATK